MKDLVIQSIESTVKKYPAVIPLLTGKAALAYCEIKAMRRDANEPGLEEKTQKENKIDRILRRRFTRQEQEAIKWIETNATSGFMFSGDLLADDPEASELMVVFYEAIVAGLLLSQLQTGISVESGTIELAALDHSRTYVTAWLKGLDATSLKAVQGAISTFLNVQGTTMGDVVKLLAPTFGQDRAWRIAVTEVTRAFAESNNIYARELRALYPNFTIERRWFTNNDDRVCPICGALDGKIVDERTDWNASGLFVTSPPAHVNCRCWIGVTVKA